METKRLLLTIQYKNGTHYSTLVHYVHIEDGTLSFNRDRQIEPAGEAPTRVNLDYVESYDLNVVRCNGWEIIEE